jgi:uncharacterized protein YbjT (DUF2867 family)
VILVCGASGRCGGAVAHALLDAGRQIRALTRNPNQGSVQMLAARGAEILRGDLMDPESLARCVQGARQAFLVTSSYAGFREEIEAGANLVRAASRSGLEHLVFLSVVYADTNVPHCATKRVIEGNIADAGVPYTILRAGYFLETLPSYFADGAIESGTLVSVLQPDVAIPWVAIADVGKVVAHVLRGPAENKTYALASRRRMSIQDVAAELAGITRREIHCEFTPVRAGELLRGLAAAGYIEADKAEEYLAQLADVNADYHAGIHADVPVDPEPLLKQLTFELTCPVAYVHAVAASKGIACAC